MNHPMKTKGPQTADWYVFFLPSNFLMLIYVLLHMQLVIYLLCNREAGRLQQWKKAQTPSFGPLVSVFIILFILFESDFFYCIYSL